MSASKRIIHFRFGFANADALSQGKTGTECRGGEHDITVTWSITGGKREISMDGREVQYSAGKRANASRRADMLETSFRLNGHTYELTCYAYKPAAGSPEKRNPRWKQYNLIIDGRSFFDIPQIFDLGLKGLHVVHYTEAPSQVYAQSHSGTSMSGISSYNSQPANPGEVKHSIQSRIADQRRMMNTRKQVLTHEKEKIRVVHEEEKKNPNNPDLDSNVFSHAPSELSEMRNRQNAPPPQRAPVPTKPFSIRSSYKIESGDSTPAPPRKPEPYLTKKQYKIQTKPQSTQRMHQTKMHQQPTELPPQQERQIQAHRPNQQPHNQQNSPRAQQQQQQQPRTDQPQRYHIEAQQPSTHKPEAAPRPTPTQPSSSQSTESRLVFAPQLPPTYEQIVGTAVDHEDSVAESNAVESAIVPAQYQVYTRGGANDNDRSGAGDTVSVAEDSVESRMVPAPQGFSRRRSFGEKSAITNASSSVDDQGVNKFGYF